ncbi:mannitol dehydrogenase family protein [uncultured Microbacterium sp.]|uniref:Mannitol-1-phosphate 5-dehydrogenase n=1 Tax=uncultured Microbacterium sp. TaxID=191216 RepID=A0A1Y5NUG4_9MICO|nr:mannitol dehydrogenase family protein [uncultured Microbacterium sp.]SBS70016.1 Mannitol-1-phosphate/altronate dehydrogenase [uncultured Microbacterium sp.]
MSTQHLNGAAYLAHGGTRPTRVRIVHIGLGNFHRAHQAWYTAHAADAADWGIAAFTGRSADQADLLAPQDGLYCLVVRGEAADRVEVVPSVVEVHDGARLDRLTQVLADPDVAIVTLTVTEAGYLLTPAGDADLAHPAVAADVTELTEGHPSGRHPTTALGRLLLGLDARRRAGGGPLAVIPCDNIPGNGAYVRRGLLSLAGAVSAPLAAWITAHVSFVGTSVDRITPRIHSTVPAVEDAGWVDRSPVVTEPFSDWVLSGAFPAGRPAWETAGARFVDDLEPWENRKLWLLNGAHSILSFAGLTRGLTTVAEAIADGECRALVDAFWDEAVQALPEGIEHVEYRAALIRRFANHRIEHRLAQIAADDATKVRYRFAAVAEASLDRGVDPAASAAGIAVWIDAHRRGVLPGPAPADPLDTAAMLAAVSSRLTASAPFLRRIDDELTALHRTTASATR